MIDFRIALDDVAEALVVPSFTRVGCELRRRLFEWTPVRDLPMQGRVVAVTGATSGLGFATAAALAAMGARVLIVARDRGRAETALAQILRCSPNEDVAVYLSDLSDLTAVQRVVAQIRRAEPSLDVLIHNAGGIVGERTGTVDGFESTFASMVLGPFVLTEGLIPLLTASNDARLITVVSGGMYTQALRIDDLQMEHEPYRGSAQYARAKRAQAVFTRIWAKRLHNTSVVSHAMHPGWADTPGIDAALPRFRRVMSPLLRSPDQGADTTIWLAAAPEVALSTGRLWLDRRSRPFDRLPGTRVSADEAGRLWKLCFDWTRPWLSVTPSDHSLDEGRSHR